ncbi:MAG: DsbC family protein [Spongiibacter sp.]|uniref:Thiol:disulfide interchange protein n=1 Tax=Spongiibacter thalassae TaxID=2721624 RepID=A0ABX1GCQ5_9GAMM|nr:DsbC family protein [Spongiibacter thalassae]MDX1504915.1 DsbC family protein [Spongiibacter sp.]NKI16918.1 DsbC family protein [Spongiibacter thalassae]
MNIPVSTVLHAALRGLAVCVALTAPLSASAETFVDKAADTAIRKAFQKSRPDLIIEEVVPSEMSGVYRVEMENGPTLYSSANGQFFIVGDLYEMGESGIENVAVKRMQPMREALLAAQKREDMIIFSPKGKAKGAIYVFTDVDCGYCQKLHAEVPQLNANGIEVRYLAYPRQGLHAATSKKMVSAWCADDRKAAMTALKSRQEIKPRECANPVAEQYKLGGKLGVTGTPAIITEDGFLIPGYKPADELTAIVLQ